ncbi:MAG: hypothetical protein KDD94_07040 [Calditrichaeota bacterium]|nr:hypothetical protein [Calditrichota bacterium]
MNLKTVTVKIAGIYLWCLPVLSVPVLFLVKNNVSLPLFITAVGLHLGLLALALRFRLSASGSTIGGKEQRITAILLIVSATLTFISATTFPGTDIARIAENEFGHYWTSGGFFISAVISLVAFLYLYLMLKRQIITSSHIAFLLVLIGTILWLIHLLFRLTVMISVAGILTDGGQIPELYPIANRLASSFYVIFMLFSYSALAIFAYGLLQTDLLKKWVSRLVIIFSVLAMIGFSTGIMFFGMPITAELMPWLIGIMLIRHLDS